MSNDFARFENAILQSSKFPSRSNLCLVSGLFFVALSGFTLLSAALAAEKEVELLTDAEFLQPTSTLEFRFATPVASREEVGTVASNPPIRIEPAIAEPSSG